MPITTNTVGKAGNARTVEIGGARLMFSYATLIAADIGPWRFRLPNLWGTTTGRHFTELAAARLPMWTGDPAAFERAAETALAAYLADPKRVRN